MVSSPSSSAFMLGGERPLGGSKFGETQYMAGYIPISMSSDDDARFDLPSPSYPKLAGGELAPPIGTLYF